MKTTKASISISPAYSTREQIERRYCAKCVQEIAGVILGDGAESLSVIIARNIKQAIDSLEEEKVIRWLK